MKAASIGAMRHRFVLEAPVRAPDGAGGAFESWQEVADLWGAFETSTGAEAYSNGRIEGRITHQIGIRARADIAPSYRLLLGLRIFHIRAVVMSDDRHRRMRLLCEERDL